MRVNGKVAPVMVKAEPLTVAELMVSASVPEEVRVTAWVDDDPTVTPEKAMLFELSVRAAFCPSSCSEKTFDSPPVVAVRTAVSLDVTLTAVALKVPVVDPAATVTVAGTVTSLVLLVRVTAVPPVGAAALRVTVQASVPAPVRVAFVQVRELRAPAVVSPVPLRLMSVVGFELALLVIRIEPVSAPAVVGSNATCSVALCPGCRVTGSVRPVIVKSAPVSEAALMVSGEVPVEVRVTDWLSGLSTVTSPKERVEVLRPSPTVCGVSWIA